MKDRQGMLDRYRKWVEFYDKTKQTTKASLLRETYQELFNNQTTLQSAVSKFELESNEDPPQ